ncbi:MAG: sulfatase, partial [Deltaproteobacteria bacterium]|nr:sulfatase [Deltaproteobacteria bacterium]
MPQRWNRARPFALASLALAVGLTGCGKKQNGSGPPSEAGTSGSGGEGGGAEGKAAGGGKAGGPKVPVAKSRGPEHPVYSLYDNRLSAHLHNSGGLIVNAGSAGFVKYMRFGRSKLNWKIRQKRDDLPVAAMSGKTGRLIVPLSGQQISGQPGLRFRVYSPVAQRLGLRLNGKRKNEVSIEIPEAGWSTVSVPAPEGTLKAGENELLIFASKKPLELHWMQVNGAAPADRLPDFFGEGGTLELAQSAGLTYYVVAPTDGSLVGDIEEPGCKLKVLAQDDAGKKVPGFLEGKGSAVDLKELAGKPIRLDLTGVGCPKIKVKNAALVVPGEAPKVERKAKPKHVIFLVMDSLRADRIKAFNPKARPEVPVFDELAIKASFFTQAYVQGNESKSSHAAMWTSLYPVVHRMIPGGNAGSIKTSWYTIDELMKDQGTYNLGVSANGYVIPRRGFGTKWDAYRNHIHDGGGLSAQKLRTKFFEMVEPKHKEPWFGYMGWIDTHVSWRGKQPWLGKYMDPGYKGRFKNVASGKDIGAAATGKLKVSNADIEQIRALYDSNVSYQDQKLGELMAKLQEWGIADDTMLIITSYHGDELFEDGRVGHGAALRESLVWVPLIIHYPKLFPAKSIPEGADVVDIVPTLADVFGAEMNDDWQGESLLPLAQGVGAGYPRMSFASKYEDAHVARIGSWKIRV